MAYHNLHATKECGVFWRNPIRPGNVYNTTIAYSPGSLSMRLCPGPPVALDGVTSIPSFFDSNNITALEYGTVCYMGNYYKDGGFLSSWQDSNPETAVLSLPRDLSLVDPAWGGCNPYTYGALDPPRALVKTTGLVPASVLVPSPTPTDQAGPQGTLVRPIPTWDKPPVQTQSDNPPPVHDPPETPSGPTKPAGEDPPGHGPQATNGNQNASPDSPAPAAATDPKNAGNPKNSPASGPKLPNDNQDASPNPSDPDIDPSAEVKAYQGGPEPSSSPIQYGYGTSQPPSLTSAIAVGDHTFIALATSGYSIADTTIQPGDPAVTVQGTPISLGRSVLIVGSSTLNLPTGKANGVLTAADVEFTPLGHGKIRLDGKMLSVDEPAMTVSGTAISLAASGIAIAGKTFAFPTIAPEAVNPNRILTIAGQRITRLGSSEAIINGVTLAINGPAETVSGTTISSASQGLVMNGQNYVFPTPAPGAMARPPGVFTVAGQTVTLLGSSSAFIDGMLFSVNGLAKTISGTVISLASSGLMVDGQPHSFSTLATASNAIVIDGKTLIAGGPAITVSSTKLSLVFGNAGLYVAAIGTASSAFSIPVRAGESMTMNAAGQLVEGGGSGYSGDGVNGGGLGSLIMLGFGPPDTASAGSKIGATGTAVASNTISKTDVLGFEGDGCKVLDSRALTAFLLIMSVGVLALY